ncbi:OLC1v1029092C1 [Oldenlandia corymbosa var. corymbosa]|uniref:OLC1v1029092C1 n=1 Tax=Oldenlandia corymbosa var. corymbosa TaxID=529605 RepID=A0AAV1CDZ0_OLDCO|nr:OLC1v1029092C1 [Oldenlandia corymbosa var. corymbosa]
MKIIGLEEEMASMAYTEACLLPTMDGKLLRKVVSDVSNEIDKIGKNIAKMSEDEANILRVECYCCGLQEECTQDYIFKVQNSHSGKWVCGLCSEAVKERSNRPKTATPPSPPPPLLPRPSSVVAGGGAAIDEALSNHRSFCEEFNSTTRLNPKLSFTSTMREIAKRSNLSRANSDSSNFSKIARSSSCIPKLS